MKLNVLIEQRHISVDNVGKVTPRMTMHGKNPRFGILDVYGKSKDGDEVMIASFSEVSSWWVEE